MAMSGSKEGNMALAVAAGFVVNLVLFNLHLIGDFIAGLVAGYIADGDLARGAIAGFIAGLLGGAILGLVILALAGILAPLLGPFSFLLSLGAVIPIALAAKGALVMAIGGLVGAYIASMIKKQVI